MYKKMVAVLIFVIIYFAAIFFGGAHLWSRSSLILSVSGLLLTGLWRWAIIKVRTPTRPFKMICDPPSIAGIFFVIWVAIQVIPIPPAILQVLSPESNCLWESTSIIGANHSFTISLYPFITVNSLIFAFSVLLFYWLALYGLESRRQIQRVILGLLILGLFESVYGLFQMVSGEPYILWWEKAYCVDVATGTFINRNHLAGFLSMLVCLGVGYIWALGKEEGKPSRGRSWHDRMEKWGSAFGTGGIMALLCVAMMIAALLSTASRGGVLSLLTGLIFMVGLFVARSFRNRNAFVLVFMLSVVCMYVGYVGADRVLARFQHIDSSFQTRFERSKATWKMGQDFPLTGTGLGTFEFVFPGYQYTERNKLVDHAHNDWIQLFAETGWTGLFIVGAGLIFFLVFSIARWRRRHDRFSVGIGLGGMGALVAISIHSLSDFNLHMPANAFLLALIVAITYLSLYSKRHRGEECFDYPKRLLNIPFWVGIVMVVIVTLGGVMAGKYVVRSWRADFLARSFRNSTIPFVNPTDRQLKKAWKLAPGNATYWSWMADRIFIRPEKQSELLEGVKIESKDPDIYLWSEGIKRNPTAWWIWRELGWAAFAKLQKDPDYYLPLAVKALERASELRSYSPQGYLEAGTVALACHVYCKEKEVTFWREKFRRALDLKSELAPKVADQLVLYLGDDGAREIERLLPDDSGSYLLTASYLLKQGYFEVGLEVLRRGNIRKEREVEKLWREFKKNGRGAEKKDEQILRQILRLDSGHPGALFARGDILHALKSRERREGDIKLPNGLKDAAYALRELKNRRKGSPVDIAYFLGRIAEEEKDLKKAVSQYREVLRLNPQYFPAWIHLRDLLLSNSMTRGGQIELENLERKIKLFEMDKIVPDAWKWGGNYEGLPSWKAPFRVGRPVKDIDISFAGNKGGAWELLLDKRFVEAWAGETWKESRPVAIPAGEHELRLVYYGNIFPWEKKKPPFELDVGFKK